MHKRPWSGSGEWSPERRYLPRIWCTHTQMRRAFKCSEHKNHLDPGNHSSIINFQPLPSTHFTYEYEAAFNASSCYKHHLFFPLLCTMCKRKKLHFKLGLTMALQTQNDVCTRCCVRTVHAMCMRCGRVCVCACVCLASIARCTTTYC